jgi:flagellar biosynthetic protein FliR
MGSALVFMPGFQNNYVSVRQRLTMALAISVVLIPFLSEYLPSQPTNFLDFMSLCLIEIVYGIFLGLVMQILFSAITLTGNMVGQAIGFANAQMFDPTTQNQSMLTTTFLSVIAITVVFMADLHHLMLSAVIDSYNVFPAGSPLPVADFAQYTSKTVNQSFVMGFRIGAPFLVFSIVFYSSMGLLSRLMPQLNIFFMSLPLKIYLGVGLLLITVPIMILWFARYYEEELVRFLH